MHPIQTNTDVATARDVPTIIVDAAGDPYVGSLDGVVANLSINDGAENATIGPSAEAVRIGGGLHRVRLTQAQVNQTKGTRIYGRIPPGAGRREAYFTVLITEYDPADAGS